MINNELGHYKLKFNSYDGSVTDFQLSVYKYNCSSWPGLASRIVEMEGSNKTVLMDEIVIRDVNDKSTDVLCTISTNLVVLEMERDNELLGNI